MLNKENQIRFYDELIKKRRRTRLFSCGYEERFEPFLLDKRPELKKIFENLFESIFEKKAGSILDVGCGTAFYHPILAKYANSISGVDFSPQMIKEGIELIKSKKIKNVSLKVGDIESLDFKDASFDAVLCFDALHHIPHLNKGLYEIKRVLKKNGVFISIEPNMLNPIIFIAHLIPKEERGAIKRNYPFLIKKRLKKFFKSVRITSYSNYVASTKSRAVNAILHRINKDLNKRWYKVFSIRMVVKAYK